MVEVKSVSNDKMYRIKGLGYFAERRLNYLHKMIQPGDTIHDVYYVPEEQIIVHAIYPIEDIGYFSVKYMGEWTELDKSCHFFDAKNAAVRTNQLIKHHPNARLSIEDYREVRYEQF